jgi:spore maturation protein CgeB
LSAGQQEPPCSNFGGSSLSTPRKRRILYVCDARPGASSGYRIPSFRRLGQDLIVFDISRYEQRSIFLRAAAVRAPIWPFVHRINRDLLRAVREHKPDIVFFDKPVSFTRNTILEVKQAGALTVCRNGDNPFGPRKDPGWYQFLRVFRLFDLHCAVRRTDAVRFQEWGLKWIQTMFTYEPSMQFPPPEDWSDTQRTRSVSFIGSPYEERPQFLRRLSGELHIPLVISGPRWRRFLSTRDFARLVSHGYLSDSAYREAIWQSRINLSFVTHSNEDDIAYKSVEIAACQGFLLAARSEGHQAIFEEDREAVFFSSLEECADKCRFYLDRPELREAIARRGRERAVRSGYDNDTQLARILNHLDGSI